MLYYVIAVLAIYSVLMTMSKIKTRKKYKDLKTSIKALTKGR